MNNYYAIEIQSNADGTSGFLPFGFAEKGDAEGKYLYLRECARQSSVMIHTVILMDNRGNVIESKAYVHPVPVPPEPVVEGE